MKKENFENSFGMEYTVATLDNGLKIYVMEKPEFNSCYAMFGTKYGSIDMNFADSDGNRVDLPAGTAHFLEHKLFESEDGDAFTKYAKTGASANAFTGFDRTCYLFNCADKFYENFDILLDFVQSPYFTDETVKKEQGIIGQEIRMYDDSPSWRVLFNMLNNMYFEHPIKIDIAGTVESIAEINYDILYRCYETFYNPSNMFICVCGNVDADEVIDKAQKKVLNKPADEIIRFEPQEPDKVVNNYVEEKMSVMMPMFCLGFKQNLEDTQADLKTRVCMSLLLEYIAGDSSPLYARLTREGLIGDGFDFEYFTGRGYAAVLFEGESVNPEKVRDEIFAEIENIGENGIDKKLFSAVKYQLYGDSIRKFDSVENMCMQFADCAVFDYGVFEEINMLKSVSADDVFKRLEILKKENAVLSCIIPLR